MGCQCSLERENTFFSHSDISLDMLAGSDVIFSNEAHDVSMVEVTSTQKKFVCVCFWENIMTKVSNLFGSLMII